MAVKSDLKGGVDVIFASVAAAGTSLQVNERKGKRPG